MAYYLLVAGTIVVVCGGVGSLMRYGTVPID
jgi:hypothetical protein